MWHFLYHIFLDHFILYFFSNLDTSEKTCDIPESKKKYLVCYCEYCRKQTEITLVADTIRKGRGVKTTLQFEI